MRVVGLFWIIGWLLIAAQLVFTPRPIEVSYFLFWATVACFAIATIWGLLKGPGLVRWAVCLWLSSVLVGFYGLVSMFSSYVYLAIAGVLQLASVAVGIYAYVNETRATASQAKTVAEPRIGAPDGSGEGGG